MASFDESIRIDTIFAGKLRRYHHLTIWQQLTWFSLVAQNVKDLFLVAAGLLQSFIKLLLWRPDVVFTKGGYVCLPVGMAAHVLGIPLVIHDSDAHPGLTNRVLSRWATTIATGAPLEFYNYDRSKSHYVGIPIDRRFRPFSASEQHRAKLDWGLDAGRPLVVVTGGGLGAQRINQAVISELDNLRKSVSVALISGAAHYDELKSQLPPNSTDWQLHAFVTDMPSLVGAADLVVARAGATTILELAASSKPTILLPNAKLTGGHQLKNAAVYAAEDAVVVLDESTFDDNPGLLTSEINRLIAQSGETKAMAERFSRFVKPDAANKMADLVLAAARR